MPQKRSKQQSPAVDIAGLPNLSIDDLRQMWTRQLGFEPLPRISRELLMRAVAYRMQDAAIGGLSSREQRLLKRLAADLTRIGAVSSAAPTVTKAGTRLIREWQGQVHEVVVLEGEYLWKGQRYRSLSEIARRITGTRWSGPRFFGLNGVTADATKSGHA